MPKYVQATLYTGEKSCIIQCFPSIAQSQIRLETEEAKRSSSRSPRRQTPPLKNIRRI